jgi:hypothetical protein
MYVRRLRFRILPGSATATQLLSHGLKAAARAVSGRAPPDCRRLKPGSSPAHSSVAVPVRNKAAPKGVMKCSTDLPRRLVVMRSVFRSTAAC